MNFHFPQIIWQPQLPISCGRLSEVCWSLIIILTKQKHTHTVMDRLLSRPSGHRRLPFISSSHLKPNTKFSCSFTSQQQHLSFLPHPQNIPARDAKWLRDDHKGMQRATGCDRTARRHYRTAERRKRPRRDAARLKDVHKKMQNDAKRM